MGFLNRLFGGKPTFEDRVWFTRELKFADLRRKVALDRSDDVIDCLMVYHFPDTGDRLRSELDELDLDYQQLSRPGSEMLENFPTRIGSTIALLDSNEIPEEVKRGREKGGRSTPTAQRVCHVHLAEHFPIPYRDDHVLNLSAFLPSKSQFFCYVGLDEPWFDSSFGGTTRSLLEQLGMPDDEPLVHSMIASALRRSQEQLAEKQRGIEYQARSSEVWMERNVDGYLRT